MRRSIFLAILLGLVVAASTLDAQAQNRRGRGAAVGGMAGAAIGGLAGGGRGAAVGALAGIGVGAVMGAWKTEGAAGTTGSMAAAGVVLAMASFNRLRIGIASG